MTFGCVIWAMTFLAPSTLGALEHVHREHASHRPGPARVAVWPLLGPPEPRLPPPIPASHGLARASQTSRLESLHELG
jgi:hypothetical protein